MRLHELTDAYQLVNAGRVARVLASQSAIADSPRVEGVARELAPVLKDKGEQAVVETWVEAVAEHGEQPTAAQVRKTLRAGCRFLHVPCLRRCDRPLRSV